MKHAAPRPFADPEAAARKLVEIASGIEPVQDGRIFIERVNMPFLRSGGNGEEFRAGIMLAHERDMLELHESGTYVRLLTRLE
ncbi:hypothetical protein QY049_03960 [Bradyrhizobium sp. WYCCWR 13022]|nr:hypothetical protein [Bradyrhizobium sp. WYCCWR 13022]MDN4982378.1 hypothetical protein [Bradyrhizobium sp. WYCCWR 13022]